MAGPVRFHFKDVRTGKGITLRHDAILTSTPDAQSDGETTWITCVGNQRVHVDASPGYVQGLLSSADPEAGIDEVLA